MTDSNAFDFTKFVPGFDFLKNLTPHASTANSGIPGWVAPTLDPQEIDKRIQELKTVQFWLEQNVDRKSTRLNSSHIPLSRMPSSA